MLIVDVPCAVPRYQPDEETCRLWSVNPMEHSRGRAPAPSQLKVIQVEENKGIDESSDQLRKIGAWGLEVVSEAKFDCWNVNLKEIGFESPRLFVTKCDNCFSLREFRYQRFPSSSRWEHILLNPTGKGSEIMCLLLFLVTSEAKLTL